MAFGAPEIDLLVRVIPMGIGAAFTPSLLALQILTATAPRWFARTLAFAVGSASAFLIACIALYFGFAQLPQHKAPEPNIVGGYIWLGAALLLATLAFWLFIPHRDLSAKMEAGLASRIGNAHLITFFSVAFALSIKDITSFALIVPAMHDVAAADVDWLLKLGTVGIIWLLALFPVLLPPAWRLLRGDAAKKDLGVLYRFTMDHQFQILGTLAVIFGLYAAATAFGPHGFGLYGLSA
jgi:hypothetical protein